MGRGTNAEANTNFDPSDPRVNRTRAAVYDAGLAMLFESGPEAITHVGIANAAHVSRTTLYKHWPSRVDLLIDICNQIESDEPIPPTGDVRADLVRMTAEMATTLSDPNARRVFSSMMAQAQYDDEAREVLLALTGTGLSDLAAILDAGAAAGDLPTAVDAQRAAGRLLGPLLFGALITGVEMTTVDIESIVDDFLATTR